MRKWIGVWFAWRFSLTRLVIAVLFLGAFLGLNTRRIGPAVHQLPESEMIVAGGANSASQTPVLIVTHFRGWPFPFTRSTGGLSRDAEMNSDVLDRAPADFSDSERDGFFEPPWTHRTYSLISPFRNPPMKGLIPLDLEGYIVLGVIDALFALTVLALILFLQLPRRKVAAKGV